MGVILSAAEAGAYEEAEIKRGILVEHLVGRRPWTRTAISCSGCTTSGIVKGLEYHFISKWQRVAGIR